MNFENQDILKNVKLLNADKVQGQGEMKNNPTHLIPSL